jgi:tetratricopeptide (TPR) repeat protein
MLTSDEQRLFADLSVFAGSPDLEALQNVAGVRLGRAFVEPALSALVNHGLVRRTESNGAGRFSMLQTVRAYAARTLQDQGDEVLLRRCHAEYYLGVGRTHSGRLDGPMQAAAIRQLEADRAEFDGALQWAAGAHGDGGDLEISLGLIGALWQYWQISGHTLLPRKYAEDALKRAESAEPALRAAALSGAGTLCWLHQDIAAARDYHRGALEDYRRSGNLAGMAWSMLCLAVQDIVDGDLDAGASTATEALRQARTAQHTRTIASALSALGVIAMYRDDPATAERLQLEALSVARKAQDLLIAGVALINLSDITESRGDYSRSAEYVVQSIELGRQSGDTARAVFGVEAMAELRLRLGAPRSAARLLGAAHTYRADTAQPLDEHERQAQDEIIEQIRTVLGDVTFAVAWREGESLSLQEATEEALHSSNEGPE